jgi:hypothetical protein
MLPWGNVCGFSLPESHLLLFSCCRQTVGSRVRWFVFQGVEAPGTGAWG